MTRWHTSLPGLIAVSLVLGASLARADADGDTRRLAFLPGESGSFSFDTGVVSGLLRQAGQSIGLVPVRHTASGRQIAAGTGLLNHYRVFTRGKRYGYGARRWPSEASLQEDGSVEVLWASSPERPFELRACYRWVAPNAVELTTAVHAEAPLAAFEVFLATYFEAAFTDSRIFTSRDPRHGRGPAFVTADKELGEWLAFPRDELAASVIRDGRWGLEPHPLDWTLMPPYALPLAVRRDPASGLTLAVMTEADECFAVYTPHGEEPHLSNYMSLFGRDLETGGTAEARSRLVILSRPTPEAILAAAEAFLGAPR